MEGQKRKHLNLRRKTSILLIWFLFVIANFSGLKSNIFFKEPSGKQAKEVNYPKTLLKPSSCKINEKVSDFLVNDIGIGWEDQNGAPDWMREMCPDVVEHFDRFPYFSEIPVFDGFSRPLPIQTTNYAAQSVCTMKIVKSIAASVQARLYLHASSHIGALVHGQPIPWDDNVKLWMDNKKKNEFLSICNQFGNNVPILKSPEIVQLHCQVGRNALKVWLQVEGIKKDAKDIEPQHSPFVDLLLFRIESNKIVELSTYGKRKQNGVAFNVTEFFPTQPFYFGGVYFMGPRLTLAERVYKFEDCVMSSSNYHIEKVMPKKSDYCINCRKLADVFPFVYDTDHDTPKMKTRGSDVEQQLYPFIFGSDVGPLVDTSIEQRNSWFNESASQGQIITNQISNLNEVEIDNSIASLDKCNGSILNVIEFNAERGRRWLESAELLGDADVIILNEMDNGMARSDQQHTTRLLARYLGMNYAFGVEFVELTLGDKGDRSNLGPTETNFHGLHGNAILSKCKILDAIIFRNDVGLYFADKSNRFNANGLEKRLGGRMILLSHIDLGDSKILVVGSTHKLNGYRSEIKDFIQSSPAIIAGDQGSSFCGDVGLAVVRSDTNHFTWPASCTSLGKIRGDNICSNMIALKEEYATNPCVTHNGIDVGLGDHAVIGATFAVPWNR